MRGTSAASLRELTSTAERLFASDGEQSLTDVAADLFGVEAVIDSSNQAVRLLSDPGREFEIKQSAVRSLFADRIGHAALELTLEAVARRWSEQQDLLDALETLGVVALLHRADSEDALVRVEEELFQFSRIIGQSAELSEAFDAARERPEERRRIARTLLEGRAHPLTELLAAQAVGRLSDVKPAQRVLELAELASERRRRLLAVVTSARELSDAQSERLSRILASIYGREVQMNLEVEPDVVGGLRIQVGDDQIDASVLARLEQARARLVA
ncbi:MAG: F0F1 ATP synthase subunit delta [Brachybacterium sp.]|nr:F0F1 ATP synthase subunit delta [Brachybacterium sp.]